MQPREFRTESMDILTNLYGEFAGRTEDQDLRMQQLHIKQGERGQGKCGGFARAGFR